MNLQVQYTNGYLSIQIKKPGQNHALKNWSMHANFVALDKFQTAVEMEEFKVQALMHAVRFVFNYF